MGGGREVDILYKLMARELAKENPDDPIILKTTVAILLSRCNLKCRDCHNHAPEMGNELFIEFEQFKKNLENLLLIVDQINTFAVSGGEILLYKDVDKVLYYLSKIPQIRNLLLVTNGTVLPPERVLTAMKDTKTLVEISGGATSLQNSKQYQLISLLEKYSINYTVTPQPSWINFNTYQEHECSEDDLIAAYERCWFKCFGFINNRLYLCGSQWMQDYFKIHTNENEYIDVNQDVTRSRIKLRNVLHAKYISACKFCEMSKQNPEKVIPYIQL